MAEESGQEFALFPGKDPSALAQRGSAVSVKHRRLAIRAACFSSRRQMDTCAPVLGSCPCPQHFVRASIESSCTGARRSLPHPESQFSLMGWQTCFRINEPTPSFFCLWNICAFWMQAPLISLQHRVRLGGLQRCADFSHILKGLPPVWEAELICMLMVLGRDPFFCCVLGDPLPFICSWVDGAQMTVCHVQEEAKEKWKRKRLSLGRWWSDGEYGRTWRATPDWRTSQRWARHRLLKLQGA